MKLGYNILGEKFQYRYQSNMIYLQLKVHKKFSKIGTSEYIVIANCKSYNSLAFELYLLELKCNRICIGLFFAELRNICARFIFTHICASTIRRKILRIFKKFARQATHLVPMENLEWT